MSRRIAGALALMLCTVAHSLAAQARAAARGKSAEVSLVFATLSGDGFEDTGASIGLDAALALPLKEKVSLALGVQGTRNHDSNLEADITGIQVYVEPRMFLQSSSPGFHPYLLGRFGFVNASGSATGVYGALCLPPASGERSCSASRSGFTVGAGAGAEFSRGSGIRYHASASFHLVNLGDMKGQGETLEDSSISGTAILIRAGIVLPIGGK